MLLDIRADDSVGKECEVSYDKPPRFCPHCHNYTHLQILSSHLNGIGVGDSRILQIVCKCPVNGCGMVSIANYYKNSRGIYMFGNVVPLIPSDPDIALHVKNLSPNFYKIYAQAHHAELLNLNEICGIGYRKALEFLVKDYATKNVDEDEKTRIIKSSLSTCINNYIDDNRIKEVTKRAVWIGNDEAHYYKKWDDKDLNDLKILLQLTINFMSSQLEYERYIQDMPNPKRE